MEPVQLFVEFAKVFGVPVASVSIVGYWFNKKCDEREMRWYAHAEKRDRRSQKRFNRLTKLIERNGSGRS